MRRVDVDRFARVTHTLLQDILAIARADALHHPEARLFDLAGLDALEEGFVDVGLLETREGLILENLQGSRI